MAQDVGVLNFASEASAESAYHGIGVTSRYKVQSRTQGVLTRRVLIFLNSRCGVFFLAVFSFHECSFVPEVFTL